MLNRGSLVLERSNDASEKSLVSIGVQDVPKK
jgi:hypothetical protein